MSAWEALADMTPASLDRLNGMLRWLYGKVQGGITRAELSADLAAELERVDGARLADGAVTAGKIGDGEVAAWHIAEASIGSAHVGEIEAGKIRGGTLSLGGPLGGSAHDGAVAITDAAGEPTGRIDRAGIRLRDDETACAGFEIYRGAGGAYCSGALTHGEMRFTAASGGVSGRYGRGAFAVEAVSAAGDHSVRAEAGPDAAWLKIDGGQAWHAGIVKAGWGWVQGNDSASSPVTKAVAFNTAFSDAPIVLVSAIGARAVSGGAPTSSAFPTSGNNTTALHAAGAGGFTVRILPVLGYTLSSGYYYGFSWVAVGPQAL